MRAVLLVVIGLGVGGCASEKVRSNVNEDGMSFRASSTCVEVGPLDLRTTLKVSKSSSGSSKPTITTEDTAQAFRNAQQIVDLYQNSVAELLVVKLRERQISGAPKCTDRHRNVEARLKVQIADISAWQSPLGLWMTRVTVQASLSTALRPQPLWTATYQAGNRAALSAQPDRNNVESLAADIASEVSSGPWFTKH